MPSIRRRVPAGVSTISRRERSTSVRFSTNCHETLRRELLSLLDKGGDVTPARDAHFDGIKPVYFEHTAWDLAVATQALSHIDTELAYAISRIYPHQQAFERLENGFYQSALGPCSSFLRVVGARGLEPLTSCV